MSNSNTDLLDGYLLNDKVLSRAKPNILAFAVLLILVSYAGAYNQVGEAHWAVILIVYLGVILHQIDRLDLAAIYLIAGLATIFLFKPGAVVLIYLVGWIHANIAISGYRSKAKQRMAELNQTDAEAEHADSLLERGLLKYKIFHPKEQAIDDFNNARQLSGGTARLQNSAAQVLLKLKRYREAKFFLERALEAVNDEKLQGLILKNQAQLEKRLRRI